VIGEQLQGRYRILERLGEGAMGEVYLAEHIQLGRQEAIKVLQSHVAESPQLVARFRREARTINRLQHPNIVSVYDFGQMPDGRFYLAMEYVVGSSLAAVLRRQGPLPVPRALAILAQLADALQHAHDAGVIHRDLKPENVMLSERRGQADVVKVLDFGLAKIVDPVGDDTISTTSRGAAYGTPAYMAPEQFLGGEHDARTDLYAFGCLAYELLVGAPPFTGRPMVVLDAHLNRPAPAPTSQRPRGIPRALDELVVRCLEKDPARRPGSARILADALRAVPGFPEKSDSGRRSARRIPRDALGDDLRTVIDDPVASAATSPVNTSEVPLDGEDALRASYRDCLREAAEQLLDADANDLRLVLAATDVDAQVAEVDAVRAEIAELERQGAHVEQEAREREASLRFSLADLRFQWSRIKSAAGGESDATDDDFPQRIETLESAIRGTLARRDKRLARITDRAIELVAELDGKETALDRAIAELHEAVASAVPIQGNAEVRATLAEADRLARALRAGGDRRP
jgi:serine/threonine protein kinase